MSENSDAVVIIVSEETGVISVAIDGELQRGFTGKTLEDYIIPLLVTEQKEGVKERFFGKKDEEDDHGENS